MKNNSKYLIIYKIYLKILNIMNSEFGIYLESKEIDFGTTTQHGLNMLSNECSYHETGNYVEL